MIQILHVLLLDADSGIASVIRSHGSWLLPVVACAEHERAPDAVARWGRRHGRVCTVVGQWLGKLAPGGDALDWLVVATSAGDGCDALPDSPVMLADLEPEAAAGDYLRWAAGIALERGRAHPSVPGPFGRITWLSEVCEWARDVTGERIVGARPLRTSAYGVVAELVTAGACFFFKGFSPDDASEADLTQAMHSAAPEAFPRTCAIGRRTDGEVWWLMARAPGRPLLRDTGASDLVRVARALAEVQRASADSEDVRRWLSPLDLQETSRWCRNLVASTLSAEAGEMVSAVIVQAAEAVEAAGSPAAWVPLDLDPGNALLDRHSVVFIDLDGSTWATAPLAISSFARRLERCGASRTGENSDVPRLLSAYADEWNRGVACRDVEWAFQLAVCVVDVRSAWWRVETNTRRGEVYGALELASRRCVQRLVRAVDRAAPTANLATAHRWLWQSTQRGC